MVPITVLKKYRGTAKLCTPVPVGLVIEWLLTQRAQAHFAVSLNYC